MLPLAVPGLIVVGVSVFIGAYAQQYLFAITFNQVAELQPLPAGLNQFIGYQTVEWNQMMAAAPDRASCRLWSSFCSCRNISSRV